MVDSSEGWVGLYGPRDLSRGGVRQRDGLWGRLGDPVWGPGGLGHSHLKSCGGRLPEVAAPGSRRVPAPREPVTPPWKCRVPEPPVASSSPFRVSLWGLQVWGSLLPPETSPPPPRPSEVLSPCLPRPSPAVLPGWVWPSPPGPPFHGSEAQSRPEPGSMGSRLGPPPKWLQLGSGQRVAADAAQHGAFCRLPGARTHGAPSPQPRSPRRRASSPSGAAGPLPPALRAPAPPSAARDRIADL